MNKLRALLLFALACTPASARAPDRPGGGPDVTVVAAGDTARIYVSWTAGVRATGYLVSATAAVTTGTWVGLPSALATTSRTHAIVAMNATADSADFTVCVASTNSSGSSAAGCSTPRRWRRLPGAPVVTIDSVIALDIKPDAFNAVALGQQQLCPFARFRGDTVALLARYAGAPTCVTEDQKLRLAGKHRPSVGQQAAADAICLLWTTSDPGGSTGSDACPGGLGSRAWVVQIAAR